MSRITSAAAIAALTISAVVAPAGAAFAKSAAIDDGKGDTYSIEGWDDTTGQPIFTPSSKNVNADLDKVVVKHTDKRIVVTARYFSLDKDGMEPAAGAILKTDEGSGWSIYAGARRAPDGWETIGGVYGEQNPRMQPARARGLMCEGFKADVDWRNDEIVVSAPRSCFGKPAWVKAHAEAVGTHYTDNGSQQIYDNAHTDKGNMKGWTDRIRKG